MEQILLKTKTNMENKEVIGNSQHGFTKGKQCLLNSIIFSDGAAALMHVAEQLQLSAWT